MKSKLTTISLTGGLGNQLFQLAAVLDIGGESKISLDTSLGKPRRNQIGEAEIASFVIGREILWEPDRKFQWISGKVVGYILRTGIKPNRFEKFRGYFQLSEFLASLVTSFYFKSIRKIKGSRDIGFSKKDSFSSGQMIVGYFQSYKWAGKPSTHQILKSMKLLGASAQLDELKDLSQSERPLGSRIKIHSGV